MPDQDFSPLTAAVVEPLLGLLTLVLILSLLKAFLPRLRGLLGERAVARVLKRQALRVANDIILPDGRGGLTQIDHLVLTPTGILVIETKNYSGLIFGREREARWTQVVGRHRHPFQNPLRQNYGHIKAVETLTTTIAVEGRVVFVGRARFPKGRPPGVVDLAGLQRDLAAMPKREIPLALRLEWEALIAQARQDRRTRREHLRGVRERHDDQATKAWLNSGSGTGWTPVIGSGLRIGLAIVIPLSLLGALANNLPRANHQAPPTAVERAPQTRPSRPLATSPTVSSPTPPASTTTIASAPGAPPPRSQPEPPIRWADSPPSSVAWQRCNQARTAVLIDNSASNRQRRDHLCAAVQGSDTPDELSAGTGRSSVVVDEPWKTLHSAGELTPN